MQISELLKWDKNLNKFILPNIPSKFMQKLYILHIPNLKTFFNWISKDKIEPQKKIFNYYKGLKNKVDLLTFLNLLEQNKENKKTTTVMFENILKLFGDNKEKYEKFKNILSTNTNNYYFNTITFILNIYLFLLSDDKEYLNQAIQLTTNKKVIWNFWEEIIKIFEDKTKKDKVKNIMKKMKIKKEWNYYNFIVLKEKTQKIQWTTNLVKWLKVLEVKEQIEFFNKSTLEDNSSITKKIDKVIDTFLKNKEDEILKKLEQENQENFEKTKIKFGNTLNFIQDYIKWTNHIQITNARLLHFSIEINKRLYKVDVDYNKRISIVDDNNPSFRLSFSTEELLNFKIDKQDKTFSKIFSKVLNTEKLLNNNNKNEIYQFPITDISKNWIKKQVMYLLSFYITHLLIKQVRSWTFGKENIQEYYTIQDIINKVDSYLKDEILENTKTMFLTKYNTNLNNNKIDKKNLLFSIRYLKEINFLENCTDKKETTKEIQKENIFGLIDNFIKSKIIDYVWFLYKDNKDNYVREYFKVKNYNILKYYDWKLVETLIFQNNKDKISLDIDKFLSSIKDKIQDKEVENKIRTITSDIINSIKNNKNNIILNLKEVFKKNNLEFLIKKDIFPSLFKSIYINISDIDLKKEIESKIKEYDTFLLFIKNNQKEVIEFKYYLYNWKFITCEVGVGNNKNKEALNIFKYIRETLNINSNLKNVNLIINWSLTNIINSKNFDKIVNQKKYDFNIFYIHNEEKDKDRRLTFYKKENNIVYVLYLKVKYHKDFIDELFKNKIMSEVLKQLNFKLENLSNLIKPMYNYSSDLDVKQIKWIIARDFINKILNT